MYRLRQLLEFFRMLSFYFTTIGFYVCTMVSNELFSVNINFASVYGFMRKVYEEGLLFSKPIGNGKY